MARISSNGWVDMLQNCTTLKKRYKKLSELLPEVSKWEVGIARRQLIYFIQKDLKVYLGVCDFYWVSDHQQYCWLIKGVCTCNIPQPSCRYLRQWKRRNQPITVS